MQNEPKQFWMVYGVGCGAPTRKHESRDAAAAEARRLARANQGATFVVLEAVEAVTKREFDTVTYRADLSTGIRSIASSEIRTISQNADNRIPF